MRRTAPEGGPARALVVAALAATALACARPGTPRGGPEDRRPPVVVATEPEPFAAVREPFPDIQFTFSERISERPARGILEEAVVVSPRTGVVRVDHNGDEIEVSVEGGLRPGLVYRITVLPVIVDLFGNRMADPFELVFSTGPEPVENALAGQVLDRITGRAVPDATVALLPVSPVPDTLAHVARVTEDGLFFFRYVPEGPFNLVAFRDRNRNFRPDPSEAVGQRGVRVLTRDTLITDLTILDPDTTAAVLARAEIVDSITVRLVFSDYLDPAAPEGAAVSLEPLEGQPPVGVTQVMSPTEWEQRRDSLAAMRPGQAEPDTTPPPSRVPRPGQTVQPPGLERGGLPGGVPLPRQELVAVLDAPLVPELPYRIAASRVVNVHGIPLGGGQDTIVRPAPPPPPPPDTAGVAEPAGEPGGEPPPEPAGDPPVEPVEPLGDPGDPPGQPPAPAGDTVGAAPFDRVRRTPRG